MLAKFGSRYDAMNSVKHPNRASAVTATGIKVKENMMAC